MADFDFRDPDYRPVIERRLQAVARLEESGSDFELLKDYYRDGRLADFIEDWGVTFDPRNLEGGGDLPSAVPFLLFPRQREYIAWILDMWRRGDRGLCEKSRDCGVSWLNVAIACALCVLYDGMVIGFGSRKTDYVDKADDPKSLFWKARFFMRHLPPALRGGWRESVDAPYMRMKFPQTNSYMSGEGGSDIGRGDRTAIYFVDEAAHLPRPMMVEASLSQTTNCRIDVSSVNGPSNVFAKNRFSFPAERVFIFDWRAQPLDAKIMTPTGWKRMGDLNVGSQIIASNGKTTRVRAIIPQGAREVYRVTFSDGASTECCADHLWSVIPLGNQRAERRHIRRIMPLHEMLDDYVAQNEHGKTHRYQVPMVLPITGFRQAKKLPVAPYLLGYLLGDGNLPAKSSAAVSMSVNVKSDPDIKEIIGGCLPAACSIKYGSGLTYWVSANRAYRGGARGRGCHNPVNQAIRDLGLSGKQSHDKFIPRPYLFAADPPDRLALLQGLMDADGCPAKGSPGTATFTTVSRALAEDVALLAQTLGGTAKIRTPKFDPIARFGNRTCERRQPFTVDVKLPAQMLPFKAARKVAAYKPASRFPPRRSIVNIAPIGEKPCQCISVTSTDGLYLTDDCIVTHNSDPRKDDAWYEEQCAKYDPIVVAQEIDRDYNASVEGVLIPAAWVRASFDALEKLGLVASGEWALGYDVADEGKDKNAAVGGQGVEVSICEEWSGKGQDLFVSVEKVFDICDDPAHPTIRRVKYDADGLGANVRGDSRIVNGRRTGKIAFEAYRGSSEVLDPEREDVSGRKNIDYFANRKAQEWWRLRTRFLNTYRWVEKGKPCDPSEIVSISTGMKNYLQLAAEISQPTFRTRDDGKVIIEKQPASAKQDRTPSPNKADALVIRFSRSTSAPLKIGAGVLAKARAARPRPYIPR